MGPSTNQVTYFQPGCTASGRILILIPIIHTAADLGGLNEPIQRWKVRKLGKEAWKRNNELLDAFWKQIEETIEGLLLPYERTRVYQDGLPVCGHEREIIADMARVGSRNYLLLLKLAEKGAKLMGSESAELLVEEYQLAHQRFGTQNPQGSAREQLNAEALEASLLERRDQFMGHRISSTLQNGETGLVFLGMLHAIEPWLDQNIQVVRPIRQSVRRGGLRR